MFASISVLETSESDTEKVLADAYVEQMKLKDDSAYEYLTEQSCESLTEQSVDLSADETLTEQSIHSAADDIAPHKTDLVPVSNSFIYFIYPFTNKQNGNFL